jgi:hypothetical protein
MAWFFFQNFLLNLHTPTCHPKPFGKNSKVKKCWFPVTVSHLNYLQWPDPSYWSPNLINHSFWEWKCPLFIHTESNYENCSSKQPRVRESLGALTAQSIPSTVTWMTWRWKLMGLLCIGSFPVLGGSHPLAENRRRFSSRLSLRSGLKVLTPNENRSVKTAQALTWHPIWKPDRF